MQRGQITLMDGAMGTALAALGCACEGASWSARAVMEQPEKVEQLHRAYVEAGAEVLTTCTFRTTPRVLGAGWSEALRRAVVLARAGSSGRACVAGSIAPLEDCWRPDLSPGRAGKEEHALVAQALADAGCDLLLCETFAAVDEAVGATEAGVETGLPVWTSLTPGYLADLLTPAQVGQGGRRVCEAGAAAVLVNCVPVERALEYVAALRQGVPAGTSIGCYANAGLGSPSQESLLAYAEAAQHWIEAGACIVGGCCGTWPAHIAAVAAMLGKGRGGIRTHE